MFILVISVTAAFIISFICSLLEATILSISNSDIADISEKNKKTAKIWENFKLNIQKPIAVILVINTVAHTMGATVSGAKFIQIFGERWIGVFSVIFSLLMILWTELLPKTLGVKNKKILAPVIAKPLNFLTVIMSPIIYILHLLNRPFESKSIKKDEMDLIYEINALAKYAESSNQISREQQMIMERSMGITEKTVKGIMVKTDRVKFFSNKMSMHKALIQAHIYRHTRYILIDGEDEDKVIGYINFKDIVSALHINPKNATLEGISRPVICLNDEDGISAALTKLLKSYQHIAVVKNSFGKTVGMVTVEDLLETIVGKIEDEYDLLPAEIIKKSEKLFFISGGAMMPEIAEKIRINEKFENINIHNFILKINGGNLPADEIVQYKNLKIKILKIRREKIFEVMVEIF
jgi:putative hemolysin